MAQNSSFVMLGFVDEIITDKYKGQLHYTLNKMGGVPDYPENLKFEPPICPLCKLARPLIVQVYAPLENLEYHRTLYLFACINPNCWSSSESWLCLRMQVKNTTVDQKEIHASQTTKTGVTDWCSGADDWDDEGNLANEHNGNLASKIEKMSDEEDSCSLEDSIRSNFGNINLDDDQNANKGIQGGAVGRLSSPTATAEIEGNEGEVISIDTPTFPQRDIRALMQEVTPVPQEIFELVSRSPSIIQFTPYFISVWEESQEKHTAKISDSHIKELLQEYQQNNDGISDLHQNSNENGAQAVQVMENYEKTNPLHGDKMFHHFLMKVQTNPGQILRYDRGSAPLLMHPLQETPKKCRYCQGALVFEFQLVPTIISKLKLSTDSKNLPRLDFGTVLVYTCEKSCWSSHSSFQVETVVLQMET